MTIEQIEELLKGKIDQELIDKIIAAIEEIKSDAYFNGVDIGFESGYLTGTDSTNYK